MPRLAADPEGLVETVSAGGPGPWATAALCSVDPSQLSDSGRLTLLRAWHAQLAWTEAQAAAALVSHVGAEPIEPAPDELAADHVRRSRLYEAGLVLRMSDRAVRSRFEVARDLATRLTSTASTLRRGEISWQHARVLSESLAGLDDQRARVAEQTVLPAAVDQTSSRLRQRCVAQVDRLDVDAARGRTERAHRERRVDRFGDGAGQACLQVWSDPRDVLAI